MISSSGGRCNESLNTWEICAGVTWQTHWSEPWPWYYNVGLDMEHSWTHNHINEASQKGDRHVSTLTDNARPSRHHAARYTAQLRHHNHTVSSMWQSVQKAINTCLLTADSSSQYLAYDRLVHSHTCSVPCHSRFTQGRSRYTQGHSRYTRNTASLNHTLWAVQQQFSSSCPQSSCLSDMSYFMISSLSVMSSSDPSSTRSSSPRLNLTSTTV